MKSQMIETADYIPAAEKGSYSDLQVLQSAAGWYIGTLFEERNDQGELLWVEPGSRDSEYFATQDGAAGYLRLMTAGIDLPVRLTP